MSRWRGIAILSVVILLAVAGWLVIPRPPSHPPLPTVFANQIYVSQVSNTTLQVVSANNAASPASDGDLLEFKSGETLATAETGTGYAYFGFPGQAEVYMASSTGIGIRNPGDERTKIDVLLDHGSLLVKLPSAFPADQRFLVETPDGAQVWLGSSMMGLQYDRVKHELYVDCLQDLCGYMDGTTSKPLSEGTHVTLNGTKVISTGPGTRNELWQFVPDLIPAPTPIPSATPNLAATQACRYLLSVGLDCLAGFPTATIVPTTTPNAGATQTCRYYKSLGTPCP
jgi:hypothetical protein